MEPLILAIAIFLFVVFVVFGTYYMVSIAPETEKRKKIKHRLMELSGTTAEEAHAEIALIKKDKISSIPFIQESLSKFSQTGAVQKVLRQADIKMNVGVLVLITLVAGVAGFLICQLIVNFLLLNLMIAIGTASLPFLIILYVRKSRFRKFEEQLPESLDLLTRAIKAGHTFNTGIEMIADEMAKPIGKEFRITFDEQNFGLPLQQALYNMVERVPLLDLKFFVTAVLMQKETGGNLAEVLTNISRLIRERFKIQGEVRTYSAQGRLTGYVLSSLPIVAGLGLATLNWEYMKPLFYTKIGHYLLSAALFGQVVGYVCIRKIVNIKI